MEAQNQSQKPVKPTPRPVQGKRPATGKPAGKAHIPPPKGFRPEDFKKEIAVFGNDVKNSLMRFLQQWEKFKNILQNNFELGRMHLGLGNLKDALLRFKFVLWLDPKHIDAMYYLGATYVALNKKKEAAEWLAKAAKLRPNFEEAKYLLCVVKGKSATPAEMPTRMPVSLATEFFDGLARDYNREQLEVLKYEGHIHLNNILRSCTIPGRMDYVVLELGVGTGLCGSGIRDIASHLTGVDISTQMLNEAMEVFDKKGKKVYDALVRREALEFLKDCQDNSYDIIMSGAMFSYVGALDDLFREIARVLKPKGLLAFSADVQENGEGFTFAPADARFLFSKPYLQELAARNQLKELRLKDYAVYADYPAWIGVLEKAG